MGVVGLHSTMRGVFVIGSVSVRIFGKKLPLVCSSHQKPPPVRATGGTGPPQAWGRTGRWGQEEGPEAPPPWGRPDGWAGLREEAPRERPPGLRPGRPGEGGSPRLPGYPYPPGAQAEGPGRVQAMGKARGVQKGARRHLWAPSLGRQASPTLCKGQGVPLRPLRRWGLAAPLIGPAASWALGRPSVTFLPPWRPLNPRDRRRRAGYPTPLLR